MNLNVNECTRDFYLQSRRHVLGGECSTIGGPFQLQIFCHFANNFKRTEQVPRRICRILISESVTLRRQYRRNFEHTVSIKNVQICFPVSIFRTDTSFEPIQQVNFLKIACTYNSRNSLWKQNYNLHDTKTSKNCQKTVKSEIFSPMMRGSFW